MASKNATIYCLIGALSAAAILGANVWALRGNLRASQVALTEAHSSIAIIQHEAAMCRGMIGGQGEPAWQVRISMRL